MSKSPKIPGSPDDRRAWRQALRGVSPLPGNAERSKEKIQDPLLPAKLPRRGAAFGLSTAPSGPPRRFQLRSEVDWTEGAREDAPQSLRRLHHGNATAAAELDLHGKRELEAVDTLLRFLRRARQDRVEVVRVIHGRGIHSRGQPVLRDAVTDAITTGAANSLVLAFSTCGTRQGGSGAMLVLVDRGP